MRADRRRRPFTYDELQHLFDFLDDRVETGATLGRKGALAALRDASDGQDRLRLRVAPTRAVLARHRRSAPEPAYAPMGNLRRGARPLRQGQHGQHTAASHRAHGPGVRLGGRRPAAVGRAGQAAARARTTASTVADRTPTAGLGEVDGQPVRLAAGAGRPRHRVSRCIACGTPT